MTRTLSRALFAVAGIALVLTLSLGAFVFWNEPNVSAAARLSYYQLYADALKAIIVGFGVALVGVLLPAILAETRSRFDRLKESRLAYSQAKTGVEYLALRLCAMSLADAGAHIQSVHVFKHQALLYDELNVWLARRYSRRYSSHSELKDPVVWGESLYVKIFAMKAVLEDHADTWDTLTPDARITLLLAGRPSEKET
jgi:cyanate permease